MRRAAGLVLAAVALAGCGAHARVPAAPVARGVPAGYRATQVWHARLTGGRTDDVIVASSGPPRTRLAFHSADLRVLSWDDLARRWYVSFDAQKLDPGAFPNTPYGNEEEPIVDSESNRAPHGPLLDSQADVKLDDVAFARLLPGHRKQLVFGASMNYGGSGVPAVLAVVDFPGGFAEPAYVWTGEGGGGFSTRGRELHSHGAYWTTVDPHCCPVRQYAFTVAWRGGELREIADDRPWLGAVVHARNDRVGLFGPVRVQLVWKGSPAAGRLHMGDELLRVAGTRRPSVQGANGEPSVPDELDLLRAGDTAHLVIRRGGKVMTVAVPLASMKDAQRYELADSEVLDVAAL
ncbi:MAG TPA: hypothetical protein VGU02_01585 [Gaiellaceae bacterium]|nr:hypothetical protein [Gaiellaceae bacterium]